MPNVLAKRQETALASLISSNQRTYLGRRFISEGGRLISETFEIRDFLKLKEVLLTVDIEKAFDSAKHNFLLKVLESYGSIQDLLKLISTLFQN